MRAPASTSRWSPAARPIGVIVAHDKDGDDPRFSDDDLRLAETFATRAAVAVDLSARVAGDALRRVVEAQELERRRLARELHDQTGQELTSVLLGLKAVEEAKSDAERAEALAAVREQVVETLHDVRRLAVELRPKALDDFGLVPALERLRDTFAEQTGMRVDLESRDPRAAADRRGDRALPDRAGGADEHRQACAGERGQHRPGPQASRTVTARDRGRRPRLHAPTAAARVSASSAWASGWRCWAAS